jgi:hypothetical protein
MSHTSRHTCAVAEARWQLAKKEGRASVRNLEGQSKLKGRKGSYKLLRMLPILEQKDAHDDEHHPKQLFTQRRALRSEAVRPNTPALHQA